MVQAMDPRPILVDGTRFNGLRGEVGSIGGMKEMMVTRE